MAAPVGIQAEAVVVTCACGGFPLDRAMHRDSQSAWQAAADHVTLNPFHRPEMFRDLVPAALLNA